tara:strand:+ start:204 stop:485 length:282 start_codon:yes stop_codon:yes gene_type:complete
MYNNKYTNKYINLKKKCKEKKTLNKKEKEKENEKEKKENNEKIDNKNNLNLYDIEKIKYTFLKNLIIYMHFMYIFLLFISNLFYILTKKILLD